MITTIWYQMGVSPAPKAAQLALFRQGTPALPALMATILVLPTASLAPCPAKTAWDRLPVPPALHRHTISPSLPAMPAL